MQLSLHVVLVASWHLTAVAQPSADKAALLQFKGTFNESIMGNAHRRRSATQGSWMDSWTQETDPCGPGCWWHFQDTNAARDDCWKYVACDREYGRVTALIFYNDDDTRKYDLDGYPFKLDHLSTLTWLRSLNFYRVKTVTGNIASLATLTELRTLYFDEDTPGVVGNVDTMSPLTHLGGRWNITEVSSKSTAPEAGSNSYYVRRRTYQSGGGHRNLGIGGISFPFNVYGAMPGHPDSRLPFDDYMGTSNRRFYYKCYDWSDDRYRGKGYTSLNVPEMSGPANVPNMTPGTQVQHATCAERGLTVIPNAKGMAGTDECACCAGSTRTRDAVTGLCSDQLIPGFPRSSELESFTCNFRIDERCSSCGAGSNCGACPQCSLFAGCATESGQSNQQDSTSGGQSSTAVSGTVNLQLASAADFLIDKVAQNAVKEGIAEAAGVIKSYVTLIFTQLRRLLDDSRKDARRLADTVQASYTITIPSSASITAAAVQSAISNKSVSDMTSIVSEKVQAVKGANYSIAVTAMSAVKTDAEVAVISGGCCHQLLWFWSCLLLLLIGFGLD